MKRNRQDSDTKARYLILVSAIRKSWDVGAKIPETAVRRLMRKLDIRMKDRRTQTDFIEMLADMEIYGGSVLAVSGGGMYEVLEHEQTDVRLWETVELVQR